MAKAIVKESSGAPDILEVDEFYPYKVLRVEDLDPNPDFGPDPRVNIVCGLIDDDRRPLRDDKGDQYEVFCRQSVKANVGKRSKLYSLWNAAFHNGEGVPEEEEIDTDELVGTYGRLYWGMVHNPNTNSEAPGIVRFAPLKKKGSAKAQKISDELDEIDPDDV